MFLIDESIFKQLTFTHINTVQNCHLFECNECNDFSIKVIFGDNVTLAWCGFRYDNVGVVASSKSIKEGLTLDKSSCNLLDINACENIVINRCKL